MFLTDISIEVLFSHKHVVVDPKQCTHNLINNCEQNVIIQGCSFLLKYNGWKI